MATLERRMADAIAAGRTAARTGKPRDCPHDLTSEDPRIRVVAKSWCRGWDDGNPMASIPDDSTD